MLKSKQNNTKYLNVWVKRFLPQDLAYPTAGTLSMAPLYSEKGPFRQPTSHIFSLHLHNILHNTHIHFLSVKKNDLKPCVTNVVGVILIHLKGIEMEEVIKDTNNICKHRLPHGTHNPHYETFSYEQQY